jgi:predicted DNA-binding transcriptional regulator AlpA
MTDAFHLPPGVCPRYLTLAQAAAYVGVPVRTYEIELQDGLWPPPMKRGANLTRLIWDRVLLDLYADRYSGIGGGEAAKSIGMAVPQVAKQPAIVLGVSLSARWLDARSAAAYLCLDKAAFLRQVKREIFPRPSMYLGPRLPRWDRQVLDEHVNSYKIPEEQRSMSEAVQQILSAGRLRRARGRAATVKTTGPVETTGPVPGRKWLSRTITKKEP